MARQQEWSELADIGKERLTRLLLLGRTGERRPVDELLEHLEGAGGSEWLEAFSASGPLARFGEAERLLVAGEASLSVLRDMKDDCKRLLKRSRNKEDRLAAMLGYFLTVAAGLVHRRELLTERPRAELDSLLVDLSAVLPAPWSELFAAAIEEPPS